MGQTNKKGKEIQRLSILYEKEAITNFQIMLSAVQVREGNVTKEANG